jgi:hypothetical protein
MFKMLRRSLFWLLLLPGMALAQQSETFGPFELHYSVVNTTFLDPKVAATYGITRGKNRAILNLSLREHYDGGSKSLPMTLQVRSWDLMQNHDLVLREIREGEAIYYIAEFTFINEEWRFFEIHFRPEGADKTHTVTFKRQLYID